MAVPLDAIWAIHNALRSDAETIDTAAYSAARGQSGMDLVMNRYTFFNDVLVWHAQGEEEFVFKAMESVAPMVSEPYERDHRGLAFNFHLRLHLDKEEAHLYRINGGSY